MSFDYICQKRPADGYSDNACCNADSDLHGVEEVAERKAPILLNQASHSCVEVSSRNGRNNARDKENKGGGLMRSCGDLRINGCENS